MRNTLQLILVAMAIAAALAACGSPTPTPTATPRPTPTPVPTATPTPEPITAPTSEPAPGAGSLAASISMLTGPLSEETQACFDGLQASNPEITLESLMSPDANPVGGMRVIACLTDEEGERLPDMGQPMTPTQTRCLLESADEEALSGLTQGAAVPPALMMVMAECMGGLPGDTDDDGTVSNPNDGTDTFTPPTDAERAAFVQAFAAARGVDETAAACVADGLTAIGVSLPPDLAGLNSTIVTEGPIAVIFGECNVPLALDGTDDGVVSNPNDGSSTFTPPTDAERAAFVQALTGFGVDETGAMCVADRLTALEIPLALDNFSSTVMTQGPIAAILAECGVSLGGG